MRKTLASFLRWLANRISPPIRNQRRDPSDESTVELPPVDQPPSRIEDDAPTPPTAVTIEIKGVPYSYEEIMKIFENAGKR